jgi:hypothetical protein
MMPVWRVKMTMHIVTFSTPTAVIVIGRRLLLSIGFLGCMRSKSSAQPRFDVARRLSSADEAQCRAPPRTVHEHASAPN